MSVKLVLTFYRSIYGHATIPLGAKSSSRRVLIVNHPYTSSDPSVSVSQVRVSRRFCRRQNAGSPRKGVHSRDCRSLRNVIISIGSGKNDDFRAAIWGAIFVPAGGMAATPSSLIKNHESLKSLDRSSTSGGKAKFAGIFTRLVLTSTK